MATNVDVFYDFRSPYAYFASHRIRSGAFRTSRPVDWHWRPVSIDVLLNLQDGRDAWAPYVDPLLPAKRRHLVADVRRCSAFYGAPLRPPKPSRPNSVPALAIASALDRSGTPHEAFRDEVFNALWRDQRDISERSVLSECLARADLEVGLADWALTEGAREQIRADTASAYSSGVFGVPSFLLGDDLFFGNDRLELLGWRLDGMSDSRPGPGRAANSD